MSLPEELDDHAPRAPESQPVRKAAGSASASPTPTLDSAIAQLEEVLAWSIEQRSRIGYFAALYLRVTREVRRGVLAGEFADGPRMDRLDGIFAQRYLDAVASYRKGGPVTASWQVAFATAQRWRPVIVQQLLLGINAHINLDLGIAAVDTMQGATFADLHGDFNVINTVLARLVDAVQASIARSAPLMYVLHRFAYRSDEMLANFSIEKARNGAWEFAERLAATPPSQRPDVIATRDTEIAVLGELMARPGPMLSLALLPCRLLEVGRTAEITRSLARERQQASSDSKPSEGARL